MTNTVIARRYADAIFALGKKSGKDAASRNGASLSSLGELIAGTPMLETALKSPVISVEEKKAVLNKLLAKLKADKTVRNFCFLLADKDRLPLLRDIINRYGQLLDEAGGIVRGKLTTAVKVSAEKQAVLKGELEKKAGTALELVFDVDQSILGGVVLKVGDRVLDASLRAQLSILRETFKRGE